MNRQKQTKNGEKAEVQVLWNTEAYDADTAGIYILEGELVCENFTLVSDIEISLDYYEFAYGTHQVTSIREAGNNAQIEGTFQATYKCEETGRQCQVQGKYRMTLDVHI